MGAEIHNVEKAAKIIIDQNYCSASLICRRMDISYNDAFEILDALENAEIVAPFSGSKTREILCKDIDEALEKIRELCVN